MRQNCQVPDRRTRNPKVIYKATTLARQELCAGAAFLRSAFSDGIPRLCRCSMANRAVVVWSWQDFCCSFLKHSIFQPRMCQRGATMPDQTHFETADTEGQGRLDDFPNCKCGQTFEIAAVSLSVFRKAEMLWICPGCGLEHAELRSKARKRIRDRIATLDRKFSILTRRVVQLSDAILRRPVQIKLRSAHKQRQQ